MTRMQPRPQLQPERENRCPDCLFLDIQGRRDSGYSDTQTILTLTLNFEERWESLPFGRVKFGLRGGELRLLIQNGSVPYSDRSLVHELALAIPKEITNVQSSELQEGGEANLSLKDKNVSAKINTSRKKVSGITEKSEVRSCQVSTKGSEDKPAWVFRLRTPDDPVLIGLVHHELCKVSVLGNPCVVEARFEASKGDIWITATEGIWPSNISSNARAIIEREIVFHLISSYINPYISKVILPIQPVFYQEELGDIA